MNKSLLSQETNADGQNHINAHCYRYLARLMSPAEVADATSHQPLQVRQQTEGRWVLCGDVSAPMFSFLKEAPRRHFPTRLSGFSSSGGNAYCVLTHQVERHQSRLVLPLYDPSVRLFLESMAKSGELAFLLGNDDGEDALLFECPLKSNEFFPLLAMSFEMTFEEQQEAVQELPYLMLTMGDTYQVPSLISGLSVQYVSLSVLLPGILDEGLRAVLSKAAKS